jgi:hypothetical protein
MRKINDYNQLVIQKKSRWSDTNGIYMIEYLFTNLALGRE